MTRTLFSLIVLLALVGSLVAKPWPSVSDETLELKAFLQSLYNAMADKDETEVRTQGKSAISLRSCDKGGVEPDHIISDLNKKFGHVSNLDIEINCGSSSTCTSITDRKGAPYYRWLRLCEVNGYLCREGGSWSISTGNRENKCYENGPYDIEIPVGDTGRKMPAQMFYSNDGKCVNIENFGGPECPH